MVLREKEGSEKVSDEGRGRGRHLTHKLFTTSTTCTPTFSSLSSRFSSIEELLVLMLWVVMGSAILKEEGTDGERRKGRVVVGKESKELKHG